MLSVREITRMAHRLGFRPDRWDVEQIQKFYGLQLTKGTTDEQRLKAAIVAYYHRPQYHS
jgi:hypothetical protein